MNRVYGVSPRPRLLLHNVPEEFHTSYQERFPTVRAVEDLTEVDQREFDVVVTTWNAYHLEDHLRSIVFGPRSGGGRSIAPVEPSPGESHVVEWIGVSMAREFEVPYQCPPALRSFIEKRLIPVASAKNGNPLLARDSPAYMTPFVVSGRGEVLAASVWRRVGIECWILPAEMVEFGAECTAIAVGIWRGQEPLRFPEPEGSWSRHPRWQTEREKSITHALAELRDRRQQTLDALAHEEDGLVAELTAAESGADAAERKLLTAQGDDLVRAVEQCFRAFGLDVRYMDDKWPVGDRLEDLRVRVPGRSWVLVEIRGYKGGAELNDLLRLNRFRSRYVKDEKKMPDANWYVANQFAGQDPASRPEVLHSNSAEIVTFGEDDGLAISTVTLFDMLMDLREGILSEGEAQRLLLDSRGRLTYARKG